VKKVIAAGCRGLEKEFAGIGREGAGGRLAGGGSEGDPTHKLETLISEMEEESD